MGQQVQQHLLSGKPVAVPGAGNSSPADSEVASMCDGCSTDATPTEPFMYKTNGEVTSHRGVPSFVEDASLEAALGSNDVPEPRRAEFAVEGNIVQIAPWADNGVADGPRLQLCNTKFARPQLESGQGYTESSEDDYDDDSDSDVVMGNADSG